MDVTDVTSVMTSTTASEDVAVRLTTIPVIRYISFAIGSLGLLGNTFVVVVILSDAKMLKQFTNAYITNQSLLDATVSLLLVLTTAFEDDGRRYDSESDVLFCKLWLTKVWLWAMFVSSTYNLLALTTERYLAVVHPIWHKLKLSRRKVAASVALVWLFGPAYNMAYMIPTSGITASGGCTVYSRWPSKTTQDGFGVLTIFIQFFFPLFLLTFYYVRMIIALRMRVRPDAGGTSAGGGSTAPAQTRPQGSMARAQANIFKTLFIVSFCFIFCWSWNQIYFLLFNLGFKGIELQSAFANFSVVMVFVNCCINPFIYIAKYEQFQRTTKRLFCKKYSSMQETQTYNSSTE